jgi:hypothetical protein
MILKHCYRFKGHTICGKTSAVVDAKAVVVGISVVNALVVVSIANSLLVVSVIILFARVSVMVWLSDFIVVFNVEDVVSLVVKVNSISVLDLVVIFAAKRSVVSEDKTSIACLILEVWDSVLNLEVNRNMLKGMKDSLEDFSRGWKGSKMFDYLKVLNSIGSGITLPVVTIPLNTRLLSASRVKTTGRLWPEEEGFKITSSRDNADINC